MADATKTLPAQPHLLFVQFRVIALVEGTIIGVRYGRPHARSMRAPCGPYAGPMQAPCGLQAAPPAKYRMIERTTAASAGYRL